MHTQIKTNRDGSINTAHYIALGRQARADAAADLFHRPVAKPTGGRSVLLIAPATVLVVAVLMAVSGWI